MDIFPPQITSVPGSASEPNLKFGTDASSYVIGFFRDIINYFKSDSFSDTLTVVKVIMVFLTFILGMLFVMLLYKMRGLIKEEVIQLKAEIIPPKEATSPQDYRWQEIKNHVNSFKETEWKFAVIEADKLVDDVLKSAGFPGESMGERLMLIKPDQLINIQHLWDAHKLRNLLVHDTKYQLTHRQAIWAIEAFESVLRELEALS